MDGENHQQNKIAREALKKENKMKVGDYKNQVPIWLKEAIKVTGSRKDAQ
jgi:hypothetical protein